MPASYTQLKDWGFWKYDSLTVCHKVEALFELIRAGPVEMSFYASANDLEEELWHMFK